MKPRSFALAVGGAVAAFGVMAASVLAAAGVTGIVRSVDPGAKTIVVTDAASGKDVVLQVNDQTAIQSGAGFVLPLATLKTGDGVGIATVGGLATQIVVNPIPLAGNVLSVNADGQRLVLKEFATGKEVGVVVNPQTKIETTARKALALGDIRKGDDVGVVQAGNVVTAILVSPAPIAGLVESVDAENKKLVVTETGSDRGTTLAIDDDTRISTSAGKSRALKDLKQGDGVSITHVGDRAETIVVNVRPDALTGHVKSVGADLKTLVVTEQATGVDTTVVINDKTTIMTTDGKNLAFKDLKRGDGVGIAHHAGTAEKIVVSVKPVR